MSRNRFIIHRAYIQYTRGLKFQKRRYLNVLKMLKIGKHPYHDSSRPPSDNTCRTSITCLVKHPITKGEGKNSKTRGGVPGPSFPGLSWHLLLCEPGVDPGPVAAWKTKKLRAM